MKLQKIQKWNVAVLIGLCGVLLLASTAKPAFAQGDVFEPLQVLRFDEKVDVPDFSLPMVGKTDEAKLSNYQGNIIFLNFWATWCPYCRQERASLQSLYNKYKDRGVVVLSVSIDQGDIGVVKAYVEKNSLTFPNLHDQTAKVASEFAVQGVPTTYILDRQGNAIGMTIGPRPWDSQEAYNLVENLLTSPK